MSKDGSLIQKQSLVPILVAMKAAATAFGVVIPCLTTATARAT
jgi:hypothetical protein